VIALIVDICSANYQINNSKNNNSYKISNEPLTMEKYGIAFKKDNTEFSIDVCDYASAGNEKLADDKYFSIYF
jgi:hypothetical protein